ncbi:hypothetical protein MKOR_32010 [Mycolicibacillus koreensis]|nr:hypothetical protein MKOR_32010 [Mycolicibacillus koreensis]
MFRPAPDGSVGVVADSLLQRQLDEVRVLAERARELFGATLIAPPAGFAPVSGERTAHDDGDR